MKFLLPILFIILTSCNSDENVIITKNEYQKLKGEQPTYPKIIRFPDLKDDSWNRNNFNVYIANDGHEYISQNCDGYRQFNHYGGCKLCSNKLDTIISYLKKLK
jgi:hypothetical protein